MLRHSEVESEENSICIGIIKEFIQLKNEQTEDYRLKRLAMKLNMLLCARMACHLFPHCRDTSWPDTGRHAQDVNGISIGFASCVCRFAQCWRRHSDVEPAKGAGQNA